VNNLMTSLKDRSNGGHLAADVLGTMNTKQLQDVAAQMKARGTSLDGEIQKSGLAEPQKKVLDAMLHGAPLPEGASQQQIDARAGQIKGVESRTPDDVKAMAKIAVDSHDLKMFGDAV